MRAAAVMVLAAGCGSSEYLMVSVDTQGVSAFLVDADCSCRRPLELGQCETLSPADALCDPCGTSCENITATRSPDGATAHIEGCGKSFDLAIPTTIPAKPVVTATAIPTGTRASWQVDASTTAVYLAGATASWSEACLVGADVATHEFERRPSEGMQFIAYDILPAIETPFGSTHVRASSGSVYTTAPPPL